jgi:hypothetical protein
MQELRSFWSEFPKWNLDAFFIKGLVLDLHIPITL